MRGQASLIPDTDSAVRPPFAKVSLFDERLTCALVHLVFDHASVNNECFSAAQRNVQKVTNERVALMDRYHIPRFVEGMVAKLEPRSFRSLGASYYLTKLYDTELLRNQSVSDVELARRVLGHQPRDSTVTYISHVLHGEPCTKVGIVRHVACDDLNEGSFAITPYDEDGATAVAEDGKRRRISVPAVDRGTSSQIGSE